MNRHMLSGYQEKWTTCNQYATYCWFYFVGDQMTVHNLGTLQVQVLTHTRKK